MSKKKRHPDRLRNECGFTLLESLLVLTIIMVIISVSAASVFPLYEARKLEHFFIQFQQDIAFVQQSAISRSSRHGLRWYKSDHKYMITASGGMELVLSRSYDADIHVDLGTMPNPLYYGSDGNINKGGTMYVSYKNTTYKVVFQLGRGRFYYQKM